MPVLGLIHIYCGDGKGKTTAAMGLALRAAGAGMRVRIVQFLKDGSSSELAPLRTLPGVTIQTDARIRKFAPAMAADERAGVRDSHQNILAEAVKSANANGFDLLILDEAFGAIAEGLLDADTLLTFLRDKPKGVEVVLTGRNPPQPFLDLADYVSEIVCRRHPFARKIPARRGIER